MQQCNQEYIQSDLTFYSPRCLLAFSFIHSLSFFLNGCEDIFYLVPAPDETQINLGGIFTSQITHNRKRTVCYHHMMSS
jgi:hypothetical protein